MLFNKEWASSCDDFIFFRKFIKQKQIIQNSDLIEVTPELL